MRASAIDQGFPLLLWHSRKAEFLIVEVRCGHKSIWMRVQST